SIKYNESLENGTRTFELRGRKMASNILLIIY
ncbi:MAG: hypothetical protein QG591_1018, partial [Planctomycetota bacterium]|nr:hypothetical protein [Planctomycetota bacterium]